MKKIITLVVILLPLLAMAGDIYVVVPNRFSFQKEDNQYQLGSLTKFLLEKEGFKVYFENEVPQELLNNACDGLRADLKNTSGLMTSKLQLVLIGCKGKEVYTSEVGKSREKEYRKSYQEALRNAFKGTALAEFRKQREASSEQQVVSGNSPLEGGRGVSTNVNSTPHASNPTPQTSHLTLYAKKTDGGYELYEEKTNELRYRLRTTFAPEVFLVQEIGTNTNGVLQKNKEGQWRFTFVRGLESREEHVAAEIKF